MTKTTISTFGSEPIDKFGIAAVLIGVATDNSGKRFAEIYVLKNEDIYSKPASLTFHNTMSIAVSPDILSDQSVTNIMLDVAKGHVSSLFLDVIKKHGRIQIPYEVYPQLKQIPLEEFRLYIQHYGTKGLVDQVSQQTEMHEIRSLFSNIIYTGTN